MKCKNCGCDMGEMSKKPDMEVMEVSVEPLEGDDAGMKSELLDELIELMQSSVASKLPKKKENEAV